MFRLQDFNFKKSRYERPNQKWVCGRASSEGPCLPGPGCKGHCPLQPPCHPVRSLRSWRGLVTWTVAALAACFVLFALSTSKGPAIISAGELTFQHSSYNSKCADCHLNVTSDETPLNWLHPSTATNSLAQSELCLKCHNLGASPWTAHALPVEKTKAMTAAATQKQKGAAKPISFQLTSGFGLAQDARDNSLTCATCHMEHRGKRHDLTQMSDRQCQSCHAQQFKNFANGHPSFDHYPFVRRTRIVFDHRAHFETHFKATDFAAAAPRSCSTCHQPDPKGSSMTLRPFDQTCATCHRDQIAGKGRMGPAGIPFLRLPGIDAETLRAAKLDIGAWPDGADGTITPFMELLLGPAATNGALQRLAKVDLMDLSKATPAIQNDAATLAWSVKELLFDLSTKGHSALEQRLGSAQPRAGLVAGISPDLLQASRDLWFPNLAAEVENHRAGKPLPTNASPTKAPAPSNLKIEDWVSRGGWYRSDAEFSILYRPTGHADPFIKAWIDLTATHPTGQTIFETLADPKSHGTCMKCHSIDATPANTPNWNPFVPDPVEFKFTHFSHVAHFSLLDDRGCQTCHALNLAAPADSYLNAFAKNQRNPATFQPNFKFIDNATCSTCHKHNEAGDSCLKCHNYHVGHFTSTLPKEQWGRLPSAKKP